MSRRGNCHDNAVVESFFNLLKRERIRRRTYRTRDEARRMSSITSRCSTTRRASTSATACYRPSSSKNGTRSKPEGVYRTRAYSVAINYDGKDKKSDFSLFHSRLIIEMKFIDTPVKEAAVVKTLHGLQDFYTRHANIGCLLIIIYVKEGTVSIDAAKWEADFSYRMASPIVTTIVIPVP